MSNDIQYLRDIVDEYDLHPTWLAEQLNKGKYLPGKVWSRKGIEYMLTLSKGIDHDEFLAMKRFFDHHNYRIIVKENNRTIAEALRAINKEGAELISCGLASLESGVVNEEERKQMLQEINHSLFALANFKKLLEKK